MKNKSIKNPATRKLPVLRRVCEFGFSTLLSRVLGVTRDLLRVRYLGASAISDAFVTAYKIPNSLRKIFAEGAMSSALIPQFVKLVRNNKRDELNGLVMLSFLAFEGVLLIFCLLSMIFANHLLRLVVPGFSPDQLRVAASYLRILMPFIFFISTSALIGGVLQSVNHFLVTAISPVLLNIVFISGLVISMWKNLPVEVLCFFILGGGFLQLLMHMFAYFKLGFGIGYINHQALSHFRVSLVRFIPCMFSMSILELSLFIDTSFASFLHPGTVSMVDYAFRFVAIPIGVFGVAFATVMFPHLSRVATYAPRRLSFYLLEFVKTIIWIVVPCIFLFGLSSTKIFTTLMVSKNFSVLQAQESGHLLLAYLAGLFFFMLNKLLLNIFYSMHRMWTTAYITLFATVINAGLNYLLMRAFGAVGICLATSISAFVQTVVMLTILKYRFGFAIDLRRLWSFIWRYFAQSGPILGLFLVIYKVMMKFFGTWLTGRALHLLTDGLLFWAWVLPLFLAHMFVLFKIRRSFGVKLTLLEWK